MKFLDRRRYDMLIRLRTFGATHGQLFPSTSTAAEAFAAIGDGITQLTALDVAERTASHAARAERKDAARRALVDSLTRAGSTARVLAMTRDDLTATIVLPLPFDNVVLLALARQFAAAAAPCAEQFAAHGIPIAEVETRVAALEHAVQERGMRRDERVKARAAIESVFAGAMHAVKTLDVIVANCLSGDPVTLAVWRQNRRLVYPSRSRKIAAAETLAPAAPVAEPAATGPEPDPSSASVA